MAFGRGGFAMSRRSLFALVAASLLTLLRAVHAQETSAVAVEPADLTKRPELVGKEVIVDDRISRFQFHPETGFDQIFLKRAPEVIFELPQRLRPTQNPTAAGVKIWGVLRHEKGRWWCDVNGYDSLPADLDRLNRGVALLPRRDVEGLTLWANWAERRGQAFKDEALVKRGREIQADVIRAESDRPNVRDPTAHWLALAERARTLKVPEPEPSAQAHRGFRAALATARTADEMKALVANIETAFPGARVPVADAPDLSRWEKPYAINPADAYRSAPADARVALDRRLLADALQQSLELRAKESPRSLLSLSEEAARRLPDRPLIAGRLLDQGVNSAAADVASLRQSEVDTLAKHFRESLHQPEKARELYRSWLNDQKDRRLSPRDAEGRIALAAQYERLLDDRSTAVSLLRDAWTIDPQSREVADAFRVRGFRKVKGEWIDSAKPKVPASETPESGTTTAEAGPESAPTRSASPEQPVALRSDALRGATPEEVKARMGGRPNRKTWVASQGQLVEQWIYFGAHQNQYVSILHRAGDPQPRVISYYSLPRVPGDPSPNP